MDPGPGSCRAYTELNDFVGIRDNSGIRGVNGRAFFPHSSCSFSLFFFVAPAQILRASGFKAEGAKASLRRQKTTQSVAQGFLRALGLGSKAEGTQEYRDIKQRDEETEKRRDGKT